LVVAAAVEGQIAKLQQVTPEAPAVGAETVSHMEPHLVALAHLGKAITEVLADMV
jgi:hypothetical protein